MAAINTALIALIYFLVDVRTTAGTRGLHWSGVPLTFLGSNSLLIYIVQEACHNKLPLHTLDFLSYTHWGRLAASLWAVLFWTFVAYILHRKKIFLSI